MSLVQKPEHISTLFMMEERRDVIIETTYEVIRFIEHGNRCHPTMDCISGQLLIYRVQQYPEMEKNKVFGWIKQLAEQLELYHRCKNNHPYRYLNPYSVLVTKDENIALLDMEAKSNEFVLRNMQKQAMRSHFVKPIVHIKENTRQALDLYSYGKTVQFLLANISIRPALTKREEYRLAKVIEKCLGEHPKKQFGELSQMRKELPVIKERNTGVWKRRAAYMTLAVCMAAVSAVSAVVVRDAENRSEMMERQLGTQIEENKKLEESNWKLTQENQQLLGENETLREENQAVQEKNQTLQKETMSLQEEITSLQEKNQELEEEKQMSDSGEEGTPEG